MCGIATLVSSQHLADPPSEILFEALERLLGSPGSDPLKTRTLLEAAGTAARSWVRRSGVLAALQDQEIEGRLGGSADRLARWVERLESLEFRSEAHNQVVVAGKDLVWQIRQDILGNLGPIRDLIAENSARALARGYELNLILRSLDRLEVRGRDSAGLAVYASFASPGDLDTWLDAQSGRRSDLESRIDPLLGQRAVARSAAAPQTLLFIHKVAAEVGKMGDNVATLRQALKGDRLLQDLLQSPGPRFRYLAHTRWASNGVISEGNAHPVDSGVLEGGRPLPHSQGALVAVLNGDIDNYHDLRQRYVTDRGLEIDPRITTDAKIIPIVVAHHLERTGELDGAFERAVEEFEGSMAIGLMSAAHDQVLFAQKGSGQALFFGDGKESMAVASEMYGVIELSSLYLKAEGEKSPRGELFSLCPAGDSARLVLLETTGSGTPSPQRWQTAEITTRDIDRGPPIHTSFSKRSGSRCRAPGGPSEARSTAEAQTGRASRSVLTPFRPK